MSREVDHEREPDFGREPEDDRDDMIGAMRRGACTAVTTGDQMICPRCGAGLFEANHCRHCSLDITTAAHAPPTIAVGPAPSDYALPGSPASMPEQIARAAAKLDEQDPAIARVVCLMTAMTPEQREAVRVFVEMVAAGAHEQFSAKGGAR